MRDDAVEFFRSHDDITLIAHVSPDGDTLGSCLGLYHALSSAGKRVQVVCSDPVPAAYRILPGADAVLLPSAAQQTEAVVSVDCADVARTGDAKAFFCAAADTLNVDHHGTNNSYAKANYVRICAATAELAFEIIRELEIPLNEAIASCLYTGITTDTGNFAYSNTTPDTFRIAAELLAAGIKLPELNQALFRTIPLRKLRLRALAVERARFARDQRIVVSALSVADYRSCDATGEDTEGVIDSLRDIDTVEIAAFLHETEDGAIRVSMRGKRYADVSTIATKYQGGGHKLAAGCTLYLPLETAWTVILEDACRLLDGEN